MSSTLFINYAMSGMSLSYRLFGRKLTNLLINKTAGEVFTSGETIPSLLDDMGRLENRRIKGVANYVVEGIHEMNEKTIQNVYNDLMLSIKAITNGRTEGHLAIKLTAMISTDIMTRVSNA